LLQKLARWKRSLEFCPCHASDSCSTYDAIA
jgi:hypothetical protein